MDGVLTIESDEAVRLAQQLAELTGQPVSAVEALLQRRVREEAAPPAF